MNKQHKPDNNTTEISQVRRGKWMYDFAPKIKGTEEDLEEIQNETGYFFELEETEE